MHSEKLPLVITVGKTGVIAKKNGYLYLNNASMWVLSVYSGYCVLRILINICAKACMQFLPFF